MFTLHEQPKLLIWKCCMQLSAVLQVARIIWNLITFYELYFFYSCKSTAEITILLTWWINPPSSSLSSGEAFLSRGIQTNTLDSLNNGHVESPFRPQRHSSGMLQLYRKCADMTARVITSGGNLQICGAWKEERRVPGTPKGDGPIVHSPFFWEMTGFSVRVEKPHVENSSDSCLF